MTLRLAMWSGPRNISTAMMRAWENRPNCVVVDEPFYACYLKETGLKHPMHEAILQEQSSNWSEVAEQLSTEHADVDIYYQKQMTHHMLPSADLQWCVNLQHCFLIRDPFEVVNSYREKMQRILIEDIGIVRQWELYQSISEVTGQEVPVVDAAQVLKNPKDTLTAICDFIGIPFLPQMLNWPKGKRVSDGVWAPHWYQKVEQSNEFAPFEPKVIELTKEQEAVAEASMDAYSNLSKYLLQNNH